MRIAAILSVHRPSARNRGFCGWAEFRGVLIQAGIELPADFNMVRTIGEARESDGRGEGRLRAPRAGVKPPLVMRVAGAIGPAGRWDRIAAAVNADDERRVGL